MSTRWVKGVLIGLTWLAGCDDDEVHRKIHQHLHVINTRNDTLAAQAHERLVSYGRAALPQIEIALHTASPEARRRLVNALGRIQDPDGIAILRHLAVYDADTEVREQCEALLARWAVETGPRGDKARAARELIVRQRAQGHGPLMQAD